MLKQQKQFSLNWENFINCVFYNTYKVKDIKKKHNKDFFLMNKDYF